MTYPWAAGEVLTAADLNAYAGLVLVSTGTASAVTTKDIDGLTGFNHYRLVISGLTGSTGIDVYWRFRYGSTTVTTGTYGWAYVGLTETGAAADSSGSLQTLAYTGLSWNAGVGECILDLMDWNTTAHNRRHAMSKSSSYFASWRYTTGVGRMDESNAGTGIRLLTNTAATMSFSYRVYGYNS